MEAPLMRATSSDACQATKEGKLETLNRLHERHCLSAICLPFFREGTEKYLIDLVKAAGDNKSARELDDHYQHFDYSLFRGQYFAIEDNTVEIELINDEADQEAAINRLKDLYYPLIPLGCALYLLTLGGGFVGGRFCECSDGPALWAMVFPVAAIALQLYWLNRITILISQTKIENRELLRLLVSMTGLDNYRVMSVFACLDTFSRFSRAQFVGFLWHCSDEVQNNFQEVMDASEESFFEKILNSLGIANLSLLSFIAGPIIIQFSYMLYVKCKLDKEMEEAADPDKVEQQDLMVSDSMDDLGALMQWAMLTPAGKVMDLAAVPVNLKDDESVDRLWDRMLTQNLVCLARNLPDGILQFTLQTWFLCLTFEILDVSNKAMMMMNITLAFGPTLADAVDLMSSNRRLHVFSGLLMVLLMVPAFTRLLGVYMCDSHIVEPGVIWNCMKNGTVQYGNASKWSGGLPG